MDGIIIIIWIILGFKLLDINMEYWDRVSVLAAFLVVFFAPIFIMAEFLEIILGFLVGGDEEDES